MGVLFAIVIVVVFFLMLLSHLLSKACTSSKSSLPSKEDINLRNMEDASGRFYVDFYRCPYYDGDTWSATVKAKNRGGYIEFVKGDSQRGLEYKIDEAYKILAEQWERENEALLKKGIDPDKYFEELALELSDIPDCIEVTYSIFGYDRLGETSFDMEVKGKDYEWLQDVEGEEDGLTSDYISENRPGLHKRIIKSIRKNMKDEGCDPDDGMVEYVSSGVHHKDFFEDASYDYASDIAEDDDIEYTVTL